MTEPDPAPLPEKMPVEEPPVEGGDAPPQPPAPPLPNDPPPPPPIGDPGSGVE